MLRSIDGYIISRAERFAQAIQKWIGVDCFALARGAFSVSSAICVVCALEIHGLFWLSAGIWGLQAFSVRPSHEQAFSERFGNPLKIQPGMMGIRFFWLCCVLIYSVLLLNSHTVPAMGWLDLARAFSVWIAHIFMSCDPLPPGKSRVRQMLESSRRALLPAPAAA